MSQESVEGTYRAIIDAGWGVMSSGAFEAPTGRFAVVEIPEHDGERTEMREAVFDGDSETFDNMEAGWFFICQRSITDLTYGKCKNRDYALARFALARAAYEEWADS
jgi:hypothetical protein